MIILDTNVVSELTRPLPEPRVLAWLEVLARDQVFTTAVSRGEMLYGIRILPAGRRREQLLEQVEAIFSIDMVGQVLPYDEAAADACARIMAQRRTLGRPVQLADAMIAGIAHSRGATLATRNLRDFAGCGLTLIDPWQ